MHAMVKEIGSTVRAFFQKMLFHLFLIHSTLNWAHWTAVDFDFFSAVVDFGGSWKSLVLLIFFPMTSVEVLDKVTLGKFFLA